MDDAAPRFVFMLTRDDRTVPEARTHLPAILAAGVRHVGAKDVGLSTEDLHLLLDDLRAAGCTTYLEVVSESRDEMMRSARSAVRVRPDFVVGGTEIGPIAEVLAGSGIRFFPYVGGVVGHPCRLRGSIEEIAADARAAEVHGVDGINLLAYRYDGDVEGLVRTVLDAVSIPVLCAGSVDSEERIRAMRRLGVWGFTIGTAVLDLAFVPGRPIEAQLRHVLEIARA